ncbi:3-hydroxyacyl-CoA dehydrogenase NAD-binding domain-containing protein [Pseudaestuariivita sp.]|uniref:3-hydroxyacyl-CoA dehydrogenase NAD-binding domain-containing protein n=1 Tax=Pseudaestuariivita sp. TaxID=2211669 RepID=UPI00405A354E
MTVTVEQSGDIARVTIDNPPVHAISHAVREGLVAAIARTEAMDVVAVVLRTAGKTFVAGADVREFNAPPQPPHLPGVVTALESVTKPWVAALHGAALGGGLELALGCHYRVALHSARMGLPEVLLGLIPGAGGTVRLPRLVGAHQALSMATSGRHVPATEALETGLIDHLVDADLDAAAEQFARACAAQPLPLSVLQRPLPAWDANGFEAEAEKVARRARGQLSPVAAADAVRRAMTLPPEEALAAERSAFLTLKDDPQSKALRHIFFAERAAGKSWLTLDTAPAPHRHIGVVGGGNMGAGIAAACLLAGLKVTLVERDATSAAAGRKRVEKILQGSLNRGRLSPEDHPRVLSNFQSADVFGALAPCDLVIEAVFEDLDVKAEVFERLDAVTRPDAVLATNTSYLDIDAIAASVREPSRVIGLHFFSPAHVMKLLELVLPAKASAQAIATGVALGKRLGKVTVPAKVCDGFIGNRILAAYRREAEQMLEDGALPQDVDGALKAFGFPMGVFEVQDLSGLDIAWAMRKRRYAEDPEGTPRAPIADALCEQGRFGRKAERGWYNYAAGRADTDADVTALIERHSASKGIRRRAIPPEEIIARLINVMQVEGQAILDEGIAATAGDIDVVMVNGYGFPRWRGGPMFMVDAARAGTSTR